jgi:hypothetical protein
MTSNRSITASGVINYSVLSNPGVSNRTGTLTAAGQSVTVTQEGKPPSTIPITATAGSNGSISPKGTVTVSYGGNQTFSIKSNRYYQVPDVKVDSLSQGSITSYTFNNVTSNHSISAAFVRSSYNITATAGSNGSISPQGIVTAKYGGSQTFTIKPNTYYQIADVRVDGVSKGAITSYTFQNVTSNHSISATFARKRGR